MKKTLITMLLAAAMAVPAVSAQQPVSREEAKAEHKAEMKELRKSLNERAAKDARKQAKEMKKQGWIAAPGSLPLDKQFEKAYLTQYEQSDDFAPKYITGEDQATADSYSTAKIQALANARQNLASNIEAEVTMMLESEMGNAQDGAEIVTKNETTAISKQMVSQHLGRTITLVECYRTLKNKKTEVRVMIAYPVSEINSAARKAAKESLESKLARQRQNN